jgi:hypothetical protein
MALATKKRVQPHKKRSGQHHRRNEHYLKHYWPYLPMLAIVGVGLFLQAVIASPTRVLGTTSALTPASMLADTNQQRSQNYADPLQLNDALTSAATAKANDMVADDYWAHTAPDGQTPWDFIGQTGYRYQTAGENLAYGLQDSQHVINAWMDSPSHRDNLLNPTYSQVGFGVVQAANFRGHGPETVVVAMYASPRQANLTKRLSQSGPVSAVLGAQTSASPVSRLAVLSGTQLTYLPVVVAAVTGLAALTFIARHGRLLHRSLVRGEVFVMNHPWLDISLVCIVTVGVILSQHVASIL